MEHYLVVTTITEPPLANRACAALEDAGIPVMMEHVEIIKGRLRASGFRILVPSQYTTTARRVVSTSSLSGAIEVSSN